MYTFNANRFEWVMTKNTTITTKIIVLLPVENFFRIDPLVDPSFDPSKDLRSLFSCFIVLGFWSSFEVIWAILICLLLLFVEFLRELILSSFVSLLLGWRFLSFLSELFVILPIFSRVCWSKIYNDIKALYSILTFKYSIEIK